MSLNHMPSLVVNHKRPHSVQLGKAARAPVAVGRQQDFGVAGRPEAIPGGLQLVAQLDVVVDLPIEHDDKLAVRRVHRLVAGGAQVQDGESAKTEPHVLVEVQTRVVRAPVRDALRHPGQDRRVRRSITQAEHDD